MGMFSFYRKLIPQYAQIIELLQHLLNLSQPTQKKKRKNANLLLNTMEPTYDWLPSIQNLLAHLKKA